MKTIKVEVDGKTKIVRGKQIVYRTENDLVCTYKGFTIGIAKQETGEYYVTVWDKAGMYLVQGDFGGEYCRYGIESIEDCLKMCLENILLPF